MFDIPTIIDMDIVKHSSNKQKLIKGYKEFCEKRVLRSAVWTLGSLVAYGISKRTETPKLLPMMIGFFCARQGYLLGRNTYRCMRASQLTYLNHDLLEQLGNPEVNSLACLNPEVVFNQKVYYLTPCLGIYIKKHYLRRETLRLYTGVFWDERDINVENIQAVLSGQYKNNTIDVEKMRS